MVNVFIHGSHESRTIGTRTSGSTIPGRSSFRFTVNPNLRDSCAVLLFWIASCLDEVQDEKARVSKRIPIYNVLNLNVLFIFN